MFDQRGSITLFILALTPFLLVFAGLAVDLAMYMAAQGELQTSLEAAALAGAGRLDFDPDALAGARNVAQGYSQLNGIHLAAIGQPVNLDLNPGNAAGGEIVLGVWDPPNPFAPSLDQTEVNAVRCQKQLAVPTTFLRLLGIDSLTVRAESIATSNPPSQAPPGTPPENLLPIAISGCPFLNPGGGPATVCTVGTQFTTQVVQAAWVVGPTAPAGGTIETSATPPSGFDAAMLLSLPGRPTHVPVVACAGPIVGVQTVASWARITIVAAETLTVPMYLTAQYDCCSTSAAGVCPKQEMALTPAQGRVPRAGISPRVTLVR